MAKRFSKIAEWIVIGLFIAIVTSIVSILVYRAVINSDWYDRKQTEKSFKAMAQKVNEADNIEYLNVDGECFYDIPAELFDDISCNSYETVKDVMKIQEIYSSDIWITVYFKDGTYAAFFVTDNNELYYGSLKIKCPSLLDWYYLITD